MQPGAVTLVHDALDEVDSDGADAYVVQPNEKRLSTATREPTTPEQGSALKRLIRRVVLANRAEKWAEPSIDPDLLGKPEPEVEMIMARREKSYEDQDQPW